MSALHHLEPRFDATNTLSLALLGLIEISADLDRCLAATSHSELDGAAAEPAALDHALLGLIAIGQRLAAVLPAAEPDRAPADVAGSAHIPADLLR